MKTIFVIVSSLKTGGAEMQSVWLANKFAEEKFKVYLVVLKKGLEISEFIHPEVNLIRYKMYVNDRTKKYRILRILFNYLIAIKNFRSLLKYEENRVIFSFLFHSNVLATLSSLFVNAKHYICIRSDRFTSRNSRKNILFRYILVYISSLFCTALIFNSKNSFNTLGKKMPNKKPKIIIKNAVIQFESEKDSTIEKTIKKFNGNSHLTFVNVGRLENLKNQESLILAVENLIQANVDIKLVFIGQGYLFDSFNELVKKKKLSENILFLGKVNNAAKYLDQFNYFILSSYHEGYPNSLIEAMNCGLVCLSTDCGDSYEIINEDRGIKIDGYSTKDIQNTLLAVSKNKFEYFSISRNAKSYIKNELNENLIYKKWKELI